MRHLAPPLFPTGDGGDIDPQEVREGALRELPAFPPCDELGDGHGERSYANGPPCARPRIDLPYLTLVIPSTSSSSGVRSQAGFALPKKDMPAVTTLPSLFGDEIVHRDRCRLLQHPHARWVRKEFADKSIHFAFWCDTCRAVTQERYKTGGMWVSYEKALGLSGVNPNDFELVSSEHRYNLCVKCRSTVPCEQHHIAPRKFFPDTYDQWPSLPLCPPCHREWHRILTPGLSTAYDPAYHARMLLGYLTRDNLRDLFKAVAAEVAA